MKARLLIVFMAGGLFGLGLALSGMTDPARVIGFLDVAGDWDPSLLFVMGGAVRGGDFYGSFPVLGVKNANNNNFDSSPDQLGNGSMLPTTAVDQFGATLARWFGVADSDLGTVFPNLVNFSNRNLGFMA